MTKLLSSTNEPYYYPRQIVHVAIQQMRLAKDTGNRQRYQINRELLLKYYPHRHENYIVPNFGSKCCPSERYNNQVQPT